MAGAVRVRVVAYRRVHRRKASSKLKAAVLPRPIEESDQQQLPLELVEEELIEYE